MSLHTPSELIQNRIIQSVQNDKKELLKYLIFNYTPDDKSELLIKTKLLSLITNTPECFKIPLITGSVWLTDKENRHLLITQTDNLWNIPTRISNSDADLEAVILDYLKQQFNISATSEGIFDLDYREAEKTFDICFLMKCDIPKENTFKNYRFVMEDALDHTLFNRKEVLIRRLKKWNAVQKERK